MMVLMIGGKARVGKTTLAKWFAEYVYTNGYSPVMLSFADILKQEVTKATGFTKDGNPEDFRLACQKLGAKHRKKDPDHWLKLFEQRLKEIKTQDTLNLEDNPKDWHEKCVIVDDCRYLNEVGYGRKIGALEVFVAHVNRKLDDHDGLWRQHESENMANQIESGSLNSEDMFHYRINNNLSEVLFKKQATALFKEWLDFIKCDDATLCPCPSCVAARNDREIDPDAIEKLIQDIKLRAESLGEDDDGDEYEQHPDDEG